MCLLGVPQDKVVGSMRYFASESGTPVQALTTNGNARADAMRMVHATSVYAPNTISVTIEDKRRQTFRLEADPRS